MVSVARVAVGISSSSTVVDGSGPEAVDGSGAVDMMKIEKLDEPDAHAVFSNPASSTTRRAQLWPVIILSARNLCRIASYQLFLKKTPQRIFIWLFVFER